MGSVESTGSQPWASSQGRRCEASRADVGYRRRAIRLALSAAASACALQGHAQTLSDGQAPPSSSPVQAAGTPIAPPAVSEIVVTASKRQQNINDVPESITALTGNQLVQQGIYNVQDLVKVTPGLTYVDSGRSIPVYSIRGVGFFDTSIGARPTVSVYVDEAPIPFSVEAKGAAFDLDRVEVLKGPQGTLFGQNSTGGAVNFIAAKPTSVFTAGGTVSYGRFDTGDVQGYVSGPLSPTLEGRLAVRTVHSGDYQESYTRDASLGAQDFTQARILLDWHPLAHLKISLDANGFYDGSDTQAAQFKQYLPTTPSRTPLIPLEANFPPAPQNSRAADWNPGEDYDSDNGFYQNVLRGDYDVSSQLTLTSLTTYSHEKISQLVDADGTDVSNFDALVRGSTGTFSEEVRGAGRVGRLQYLLGASYERDRTREDDNDNLSYSTTAYAIAPPPFPALDDIGVTARQNFNTTAVFANADYRLLDPLVLHAGVRFTQANLNYAACTTVESPSAAAALTALTDKIRTGLNEAAISPLQVGQCGSIDASATPKLDTGQQDQNNYSWRTGIDYKLRPDALLYFNVSKGFKAGSIQTSVSNSNLQYTPVTQESVLAYEAGLKAGFLNKRLELTAAAFYYDYTNKQVLGREVFQPNIFGPLGALVNVPRSSIRGLEGQATTSPLPGLTLTLAATYLYTRVDGSFENYSIIGTPVNYKGDPFPYTPKYQVVFDGEYKRPVWDGRQAFIGANVNFRSNTTSGFGEEPLLAIPSYTLLDLRGGIEAADGRWRLQLYGHNVTNAYYYTNVARSQDSLRAYAGFPVTYGAQLSYKY